jgi:hypothetical protein
VARGRQGDLRSPSRSGEGSSPCSKNPTPHRVERTVTPRTSGIRNQAPPPPRAGLLLSPYEAAPRSIGARRKSSHRPAAAAPRTAVNIDPPRQGRHVIHSKAHRRHQRNGATGRRSDTPYKPRSIQRTRSDSPSAKHRGLGTKSSRRISIVPGPQAAFAGPIASSWSFLGTRHRRVKQATAALCGQEAGVKHYLVDAT